MNKFTSLFLAAVFFAVGMSGTAQAGLCENIRHNQELCELAMCTYDPEKGCF
jgi:hypothetical protein